MTMRYEAVGKAVFDNQTNEVLEMLSHADALDAATTLNNLEARVDLPWSAPKGLDRKPARQDWTARVLIAELISVLYLAVILLLLGCAWLLQNVVTGR